jgi:hypothetical protein
MTTLDDIERGADDAHIDAVARGDVEPVAHDDLFDMVLVMLLVARPQRAVES